MKDRPSPSRSDRPSPSRGKSALNDGLIASAESERLTPAAAPLASPSPLRRAVENWLADGKAQGHSERTLGNRRHLMEKFLWWLVNEEEAAPTLESLTPARIRAFQTYLREERPEGRFGSDTANARRTVRPSTVHTYYRCLRAFVNFSVAEGLLDETPLRNVKPPRVPNDQVAPFTAEQVQALVDAARRTRAAERDVALVLMLVDTGVRVSELCGLAVGEVDRSTGELTVLGKGNKRRRVYMGLAARRALWRYLEAERRHALPDEPLFISIGGNQPGAALLPNGVFQIIQKLGQAAGLREPAGCHRLRHTFAVSFLRSGGSVLELQKLLGHTDLTMTRRYVALAEADLARAHRGASPADNMKLR